MTRFWYAPGVAVLSTSARCPFDEDRFVAGDPAWRLYAGRMVPGNDGKPKFMAFVNTTADGTFGGTLTDPMPMWRLPDGRLRIDARAYGIPLDADGLAHLPKS